MTSTLALHETDREGCRLTSTRVALLLLLDQDSLCRGVSGSEGRTEKRRKRDESLELRALLKRDASLDKVVVLFAARRGLGGIWRNHDTVSAMLSGSAESCKGRRGSLEQWDLI